MRLKKVFAGALAAAMLVCAVAVPAFAAEEVEQENGQSSSYVQMNIPYADFYKAAGVDNASGHRDRKSTRLNSSHRIRSRMPSSA